MIYSGLRVCLCPYCLSLATWRSAPARGLAVGEECVRHYLRCLPTSGVVVRPEVRAVLRRVARLSRPTARVAAHDFARYQPLYEVVEGRGWGYVLEGLPRYGLVEPGSVGDDLGD